MEEGDGNRDRTHPWPDRLDLRSARPPRDIRGMPSSSLAILLQSDDTDSPSRVVSGPVAAGSAFMLTYFVRCWTTVTLGA